MTEPARSYDRSVPEIAVVIPTLRRRQQLERVLDALESQDAPAEAFEVVVAVDAQETDDRSTPTALGRRAYAARVVRGARPGASATRNRGWRATGAPLVLFLDDDIVPGPSLISEHLAWHGRHRGDEVAVLGLVTWATELRVTPFMRWLDRGLQFGYGSIEGQETGWWHLYTANVSLKRSMLELVDGFDEDEFPFGYEDMDLARRMVDHGLRVVYNENARAEHLHAVTIDDWARTAARIAQAERRFVRRYPDSRPFYLNTFTKPSGSHRLRGLGAWLAPIVSPGLPWLGPRVWSRAAASYRERLAPVFLAAWARAEVAELTERKAGNPRVG